MISEQDTVLVAYRHGGGARHHEIGIVQRITIAGGRISASVTFKDHKQFSRLTLDAHDLVKVRND